MNAIVKTFTAALLVVPGASAPSPDILRSADSSMHLEGSGPVTVVFESGLGDRGPVWHRVQSSIAQHCARTLSYTRRGYSGNNRSSSGLRDAKQIVAELRTQLKNSGLPPPYVLVGHSLGGLYMQYFARRYPSEVQGLILVDSMHWEQLDRVRVAAPGVYRMTNWLTTLRGGMMRHEFSGIPSTAAEIEALPATDEVPTIVLSRSRSTWGNTPAFQALAAELQVELADTYAARRHEFVIDSGHYIQLDQPQAVINAVRELVGCDFVQRRAS
jgi:pimeloyl-ACP methyl ester carboxylesterase